MDVERPVSPQSGETLTSAIFDGLRRDIIAGTLAPGEKLKVRQLASRFGVGFSPVREALNRLSSEGFVRQIDQRGFSVAPVSEAELAELTHARLCVNESALRESIARGEAEWEEAILVAYHWLSRTERLIDGKMNPAWEVAHRRFHRRLVEACGSKWLLGFCEQLFDLADRYRHLSRLAPQAHARPYVEEHRSIMEATLARDADAAVRLLKAHFIKTDELCGSALRARDKIG